MNRKVIILSTDNKNKVKELRALIDDRIFEIKMKRDYGLENFEIDESGTSLEENAKLKVSCLVDMLKKKGVSLKDTYVLADDTGLFVDALKGAPGVYSARYSGPDATDRMNVDKLLGELGNIQGDLRSAYFATVISYYFEGCYYSVTGRLDGYITSEVAGDGGFGYDPIFMVKEAGKTLGQMSAQEKNQISHRAKAYQNFIGSLGHGQ